MNLESRGRLEYDIENDGTLEVILQRDDLDSLYIAIHKYEENVRKVWLKAFQSNGMNFDDSNTVQLQPTGKTWDKLTIGNLANGLENLPESKPSSGTNITIGVDGKLMLPTGNMVANPQFSIKIPKGWVYSDLTFDLSALYKKGAEDAYTKIGVQTYQMGGREYWIHDGETIEYPGTVLMALGWPQPVSWVGTHNQKITLPHNGERIELVSAIYGPRVDSNGGNHYLEINGRKVTYHGVGPGTVCRLWVLLVAVQ